MLKIIYLDMDGVLDNFDKRADELDAWKKNEHKINWFKVDYIGSKFWSEIEPLANGMELYHKLLSLCEENGLELKILSAGPGDKCKQGKREWLSKYCPEMKPENIIIKNKGVQKAELANSESLLIDDSEKNCNSFFDAGGNVFRYKENPDDVIEYIKNRK